MKDIIFYDISFIPHFDLLKPEKQVVILGKKDIPIKQCSNMGKRKLLLIYNLWPLLLVLVFSLCTCLELGHLFYRIFNCVLH